MRAGQQLNIYVPVQGKDLLERLRQLSKRTDKPINRLVLEAISEYLERHSPVAPSFRAFDLGLKGPWKREELYRDWLERKVGEA